MRNIRFGIRIVLVLLLFLISAFIMGLLKIMIRLFNHDLADKVIFKFVKPFCLVLNKICGIRLQIEGQENIPEKNGFLVVGNHYSYIEAFCTMSIVPAVPVSKEEIKSWPVFGLAARIGGTVFVNRDKGGLSGRYIESLVQTLKKNINIIFFPEGTTTDGTYLKRFKSALFVVANRLKVPVLPTVSTVVSIEGKAVPQDKRDMIAWYGGVPFIPHITQVLKYRYVELKFKIGKPVIPEYDDTSLNERRAFAVRIQTYMDSMLRSIDPLYKGIINDPK